MTKDEALKLALEALEEAWYHVGTFQPTEKAIDMYDEARTAIKEALAQEQERPAPCAKHCEATAFQITIKNLEAQVAQRTWAGAGDLEDSNAYLTPPQRTWVGLTEEEKDNFWKADQMTNSEWNQLFSDIEAKLKEKNT